MASSGKLLRVALVRTDFSEECSASIIRVTRIGELGTTLAVTRATRRNIREDAFLHCHRRKNLKSYKSFQNYRGVVTTFYSNFVFS
jgi:hypothetical protein